MNLIQEDATNERKFLKSQVEKRRRERMNHSLERLRTTLLQEPQLSGTQHRVEKAEILERTVLFLQNTDTGGRTRAEGGGQKHSFQDGFSTCLQRAAHFLGPEGRGLRLGSALEASFPARFSPSDSDSAGAQRRTGAGSSSSSSSSSSSTKSILWMLRHQSNHGQNSSAHPYRLPAQRGSPGVPRQAEIRAERRPSKQNPPQSRPVSQALWRPWP